MSTRAAVAALTVALALCSVPAGASAQQQAPAATVGFLTDTPIKTTWADITQPKRLAVTIRNESQGKQTIHYTIVGLPRPVRRSGEFKSVGRRATRQIQIQVPENTVPEAKDSAGSIVITGASGSFARRAITITGKPPEAPPRGERLDAADIGDQTLPGTNFVPSFLNPLGPTLVVLAVLALLLAAIFGLPRGSWPWLALPVALAIVGIALHTFYERDDQFGVEAISAKSLPVTAPSDATVGAVTTDEADIAEAFVEKGDLSARGLDRAGAYKGKFDLTPGEEKGDAALTVNVRDWWLYAILILLLGVWAGARVRHLIDHVLPRRRVVAELEDAVARHEDREGPYSLRPRIEAERAAIIEKAYRDAEAAKTDLATFQTLLADYRKLLMELDQLQQERDAVADQAQRERIPLGKVNAVADADDLLSKPLGVGDADVIKARRDEIRGAITAMREVRVLAESVRAAIDTAPASEQPALARLLERAFVDGDRKKVQEDLDALDPSAAAVARAGTEELKVFAFPAEDLDDMLVRIAPRTDHERADDAAATLAATESRALTLAGALAVASGFSLLYFEDAVWGTPADYVKAFVWGAAGAEALKVLTSLAGSGRSMLRPR